MHAIDPLIPQDEACAKDLDIFALRDRLHTLFSGYGQVQRLDLVRADEGRARRVMCFLRMSRPEDEQAVARALGMGRFGGDLVMVVALDQELVPPRPWHGAADPAIERSALRLLGSRVPPTTPSA